MCLGDIQRLLQLERLQKAEIQQRRPVQVANSGGLRRWRGSTSNRLQNHIHQRTADAYPYPDTQPNTHSYAIPQPLAQPDSNTYADAYTYVIFS